VAVAAAKAVVPLVVLFFSFTSKGVSRSTGPMCLSGPSHAKVRGASATVVGTAVSYHSMFITRQQYTSLTSFGFATGLPTQTLMVMQASGPFPPTAHSSFLQCSQASCEVSGGVDVFQSIPKTSVPPTGDGPLLKRSSIIRASVCAVCGR